MTGNGLGDRIRKENLRKRLGTKVAIDYIKRQQKVVWICPKTKRSKYNIKSHQ
jgi:hypothetical protein